MMYIENTEKVRSDVAIQNKAKIVAYLKGVKIHSSAACLFYDRETKEAIGGLLSYHDDDYAWTNDTVYHFEKYNYGLPSDFVQHIMEKIA